MGNNFILSKSLDFLGVWEPAEGRPCENILADLHSSYAFGHSVQVSSKTHGRMRHLGVAQCMRKVLYQRQHEPGNER